jgi:signal transduction histidine kinase
VLIKKPFILKPKDAFLMELSMENQELKAESKLAMIVSHAPLGLAEIDNTGKIIHLNIKGQALLRPVLSAVGINGNNFYEILEHVAPSLVQKIKNYPGKQGQVVVNESHGFSFLSGSETKELHFLFTIHKEFAESVIIYFDDITEKRLKEKVMHQVIADRTIVQGRFEITANVLHDIGNALVGFGSYLNRIKNSLEQENSDNLLNLADFFNGQQKALATVLGETKTGAVIKILGGIAQLQKSNRDDIGKSISEQQHIITHIQEILNIHRQYIHGHDVQEKSPVSITDIIRDCMSMLHASFNKRGITISLNVPEVLPVIKGDRTRLMQVILNILKNGIEAINIYAPEKTISLSVSVEPGWLAIQIKDSGHGFDEETGKKLFKRGFTTKSSGSGLGLSSCKAIVESHDGTIDMTSEGEGKGSVTIIKLKI